jgi:endo-alpha-1,4-polygalactosaminidase (GH114 family)
MIKIKKLLKQVDGKWKALTTDEIKELKEEEVNGLYLKTTTGKIFKLVEREL